jgi:hypothetical protein
MKIRPVGAEFHVDGQTDMMKLIDAFSHFANGPKEYWKDVFKFGVRNIQFRSL